MSMPKYSGLTLGPQQTLIHAAIGANEFVKVITTQWLTRRVAVKYATGLEGW